MGAPKGNQFWKQRSKHGRAKLFAKPELLWKEALRYFTWCDNNPILTYEYKGKDNEKVEYEHPRAYTWSGLEFFLDISNLSNYKTNPEYKDFFEVIARMDKTMHQQKFTGAAAGVMNANIIARDLGLRDRSDITTDDKPLKSGVSEEELDERIAKKLNPKG